MDEPTSSPAAPVGDAGEIISVTIPRACAISGLSRSKIWELVAAGRLKSGKVDGRRLISFKSLKAILPCD